MEDTILRVRNFFAGYNQAWVIKDVTMDFAANKVTSIMGPSGCGKSTLMRCINRLHEETPGAIYKGQIFLGDMDIYSVHPIVVRQRVGMVFQRPNPFPTMSIYDNVIAGYILNNIRLKRKDRDFIVEDSLKKAYLWDEVKDNLHRKGTFMSGGQQQRLCIARALAMKPQVLLLDEPTSALDPKATAMIEELIIELKQHVSIVLVTHNRAQAARVSDYTAFLYLGELIEFQNTASIFTTPKDKRTEEYLMGKFG